MSGQVDFFFYSVGTFIAHTYIDTHQMYFDIHTDVIQIYLYAKIHGNVDTT